MEPALDLADATGGGSVRFVSCSGRNLDWVASTIHWRADAERYWSADCGIPTAGRGRRRGSSLPITDVAAAGRWKGTKPLLTCYQQGETQTLLAVMAEERKVHEAHIAHAASR